MLVELAASRSMSILNTITPYLLTLQSRDGFKNKTLKMRLSFAFEAVHKRFKGVFFIFLR